MTKIESMADKKMLEMAARIEWHRNNLFKLGDNLAEECERILGLSLQQNTIERFKIALKA